MIALEKVHAGFIYGRRVSALASAIDHLIPTDANILDLGCGDGLIGHHILQQRADIKISGTDVRLRSTTLIPAVSFDGWKLPFGSDEFDVVMLIDVIHHTQDILTILMEARRVTKKFLIIKDHLPERMLAKPTLRFMDIVGNLRYGVNLPFNYLSKLEWLELFQRCDLETGQWNQDLALYPWWADWFFGRSLHFLVRLQK